MSNGLGSKLRSKMTYYNPEQRNTITGISNGILLLMLVIAMELMFFGGLISAFLVQALGSAIWPPPNQPVLNTSISYVNTALLILSGLTMHLSCVYIEKDNARLSKVYLLTTVVLGSIFILIQGYEWVNLISFGFTTTSSILASFFYVIIGAHALHAFIGLICLVYVYFRFYQGKYSSYNDNGLRMIRLYWSFVVLLWPLLYSLLYHN